MKKYEIAKTASTEERRFPFWLPWGLWKWLGRTLAFALGLFLFLLLFTIPKCRPSRQQIILGPDTTIVTPGGDTLVGKNPRLFNPENPRRGHPSDPVSSRGTNPPNPRTGQPVDWPPQLGDEERGPGLPSPGDNRIPPTNPGDVRSDPRTGRQIDEAHLLVVLNSDAGDQTYNRFAEELSGLYAESECRIVYYNTLTKLIVLEVASEVRNNIINTLPSQITDIDFYICDVAMFNSASYYPNDPAFRYSDFSWHYEPIQAYDAWDVTKGNRNVKVAVVDSYFELDHYDLNGVNIIGPISIENGTTNVYPPVDAETGARIHGTHVAGIIFAQMDNGEGACGIAPGCSFMPVSLGQNMNTVSLIEGILYAVYKGADVVNVSIGMTISDDVAREIPVPVQAEFAKSENIDKERLWDYVFKLCNERNTTIVWSAGNNNILSAMDESKRNGTTVKVAALDRNLRKADFSNFGNLPEYGFSNSTISAPGCAIMSTIPYCDYYPLDGTSMAAPIVTGAVALMKSVCPTLTNEEVIDILKTTARPVNDHSIGDLVQIRTALDRIMRDFMHFDDIMNDHSKILGRWESTMLLDVARDRVMTGEKVKVVLNFTDESAGTVDLEYLACERAGEICSAPFTVVYGQDKIILKEHYAPRSEQGSQFMKADLICTPDRQGLLSVLYKNKDELTTNFYLRKIE